MRTEIEKQFLKAYKFGGVLHQCIDVIRQRNDLGFSTNRKPLSDTWQNYYDEELPKQIKADTEAFNNTVVLGGLDSSLINEISENISECTTIQDKERYIHSLIVPFHELSELLYPHLAPKSRLDKYLEELKNDKKLWEQADEDYKEEAHKQLDAIEWFEKNEVEKQSRLEMISDRFRQIMREPTDDVEKSFSDFCRISFTFANLLDALCLTKRIDLIELQKECGTYLKTHRTITDVDFYIGSLELTQKYIDELPKVNANKVDTSECHKITLHYELLQALQTGGFIENAIAKYLKWTATNSTTHGQIPNKKSLLDLLCLLEYPDSVIRDKKLLKETFSVEFKANNYTYITDKDGKLIRPIISEYHSKLSEIVETSKQK
ncbi:hypothetical protein AGMMS50262_08610 [Bacteroidia bacterium]|nr:hypothetical protein AGMMS50262_08610 [Bacteroidia bacterium]